MLSYFGYWPHFDAHTAYLQKRPLFGDFHRFVQVTYLINMQSE